VDPIARRELWRMVHSLADDGMLILWSTSYLDEAEQCRDVLLLNQGKVIYEGKPAQLTETMEGRSFLLSAAPGERRRILQEALIQPQVSDGVIQGRYVRLIVKPQADTRTLLSALKCPDAELLPAKPRFEDAFIDLLGGGPSHRSQLAQIMPQIPAAPGETVIEAISLTKKFGDFAATDHVDFQVRRGEIFG
ncbi:ABC transporter ATP-binding protein, partial [Klebsiella pneumoniae]|nr:ABC transporter ATP-binding protein [Klebsiella pneumoniae]